MDLSPAQITQATFRTARKGYDPAEVDAFLADVAKALEQARQQATAMEARARAAVARLQEATSGDGDGATAATRAVDADAGAAEMPVAEAETISRTLLLAQRTADAAIADARAEAERIVQEATTEAETTIDSTREMSAQMVEDAKTEARKASAAEREAADGEVQALVARREFLIGDVDQLERFLIDQRDRLRGAARQIEALCERVPAGLGSMRPPVLSASDDDEPGDPTQELTRPLARPEPTSATDAETDPHAERPAADDDHEASDDHESPDASDASAGHGDDGQRDTSAPSGSLAAPADGPVDPPSTGQPIDARNAPRV